MLSFWSTLLEARHIADVEPNIGARGHEQFFILVGQCLGDQARGCGKLWSRVGACGRQPVVKQNQLASSGISCLCFYACELLLVSLDSFAGGGFLLPRPPGPRSDELAHGGTGCIGEKLSSQTSDGRGSILPVPPTVLS